MIYSKIMDRNFFYKDGKLWAEGVEVQKLAEKYGTPLYLYSQRSIEEHFSSFRKAFRGIKPFIFYSVKANNNLSLLKILKEKGAGMEVISSGELFLCKKAGVPTEKIIFGGVGKREDELEYGLKENVFLFNLESLSELSLLNKLAKKKREKANCLLRINPDIGSNTHPYITTGKIENKFGISIQEGEGVLKNLSSFPFLNIVGLHFHLGSQIEKVSPFLKVIKLVKNIREKSNFDMKYLDLGGGFPISYNGRASSATTKEKIKDIEEFGKKISNALFKEKIKIIFEPGRYLVGNSGILITKVLYCKERKNKRFLITDAGMNDFLRPSLYNAYHFIEPLKKRNGRKVLFDVVGPVCETGDFFGKERPFSEKIEEGEYLAVFDTGAYGYSMSSNYNGRLRPAEVLIKGKKAFLVRKREELSLLTRLFPS